MLTSVSIAQKFLYAALTVRATLPPMLNLIKQFPRCSLTPVPAIVKVSALRFQRASVNGAAAFHSVWNAQGEGNASETNGCGRYPAAGRLPQQRGCAAWHNCRCRRRPCGLFDPRGSDSGYQSG